MVSLFLEPSKCEFCLGRNASCSTEEVVRRAIVKLPDPHYFAPEFTYGLASLSRLMNMWTDHINCRHIPSNDPFAWKAERAYYDQQEQLLTTAVLQRMRLLRGYTLPGRTAIIQEVWIARLRAEMILIRYADGTSHCYNSVWLIGGQGSDKFQAAFRAVSHKLLFRIVLMGLFHVDKAGLRSPLRVMSQHSLFEPRLVGVLYRFVLNKG